MKKSLLLLIALIIGVTASGCTVASSDAHQLLAANGYTEVQLGGMSLWGCSDDDELTREFKAKTITGQRVEGVICAGLFFKGATIRTTRVLSN